MKSRGETFFDRYTRYQILTPSIWAYCLRRDGDSVRVDGGDSHGCFESSAKTVEITPRDTWAIISIIYWLIDVGEKNKVENIHSCIPCAVFSSIVTIVDTRWLSWFSYRVLSTRSSWSVDEQRGNIASWSILLISQTSSYFHQSDSQLISSTTITSITPIWIIGCMFK